MKKNKTLIYSFVFAILSLIYGFSHKSFQQEIKYKNYFNQRFGFSVDYPYEILIPQGESGSGDGQTFVSKKNPENMLAAYRDFLDNMDPEINFTLETGFKKEVNECAKKDSKRQLTYKKLGKDFYVLSGHKPGGIIFYQKSILVDGALCTCIIEYKEADKAVFNKISEHIFKSFK